MHHEYFFSFVKEAGEKKLIDLLTPGNANASEQLKEHISKVGLGNPNVQATIEGDKVIVTGEVASQEEKEKILLAVGNIAGVGSVDDQITVTGPVAQAARFVTVKKRVTPSARFPRLNTATQTSTTKSSRPTSQCFRTRTRSIRGKCCGFPNNVRPVGAAEGCDLLILAILKLPKIKIKKIAAFGSSYRGS